MKFILFFLFITLSISDDSTITNLNEDIPTYSKLRFKYGNHSINKPIFHFSPDYGWMNDPNGCWYDKSNGYYHLYFQYNPHDTIWGMPLYWGHAYSQNLLEWTEDKIAIRAPDYAGAYSGSIYVDDGCLSGWFNNCGTDDGDAKYSNAIAAFTWNLANWTEVQCLSYTTSNGSEFYTPSNYCPAVEDNSTQFRDPQVIKFNNSTYIMSVAKSHEYSVYFYNSSNAKDFQYLGKFGLAGYLGFQYECPNLVHLKNSESSEYEDEDSYWVLFISINPGSQQGGSSTEYFFGQFDIESSTPYTLSFHYTTLLDQGKDFYAMQIIYSPPTDFTGESTAKGITWASNWQYTKVVPTDPWRSSMAIPREIKISHYIPAKTSTPILHLKSKALMEDIFDATLPEYSTMNSGDKYTDEAFTQRAYGALEFYLSFESCDAYTDHDPGVLTLYLRGGSIPEEYLRFGFNQKADAFFLDRGNTNVKWVHDNPFFTDKLSMTVYGTETGEKQNGYTKEGYNSTSNEYEQMDEECSNIKYTAHVIIDRNIFEVFFNEDDDKFSFITSTNTFFFTGGNFIDTIEVEYNLVDGQYGFKNVQLTARQLNIKSNEDTSSDTTDTTDARRRLNSDL